MSITDHRQLTQVRVVRLLYQHEIGYVSACRPRAGVDADSADAVVASVRPLVQHQSAHNHPVKIAGINKQPWHFVVVEDRNTLREIGALAHTGAYTADAALAVVVMIERTKFAISDTSRAIQSMMLTGWSHGVGSNWVGFMNLETLKPLLHIPDDLDVLAVIPFGYPARGGRSGQQAAQATG